MSENQVAVKKPSEITDSVLNKVNGFVQKGLCECTFPVPLKMFKSSNAHPF